MLNKPETRFKLRPRENTINYRLVRRAWIKFEPRLNQKYSHFESLKIFLNPFDSD